ncbi:MAG: arsenate-mycothiol transferase ArsC [Alphaproteobacteria bacterium]
MTGGLPSSVLFVCSTNSVRSPIAEALLRHFHGHRLYVKSAGVRAREIDGFAIAVMREKGLDIAAHKPVLFSEIDDENFDVVVTLTPEAHHQALELTRTLAVEVEYWPTFDPAATDDGRAAQLEAYRAVRDQLERRILERFPLSGGPAV